MPDRVVRQDILTSDAVNALSWPAEVFYRRLMSLADDFGRYEADVSLLRAFLFPKKLSQVSDSDVVKWMSECSKAGLVRSYRVGNKDYLEIQKFGQRLRAMRSKYPEPTADSNGGHPPTYVSSPPPETKGNESESETENETKDSPAGDGAPPAAPSQDPKEVFKGIDKTKKALYDFILAYKPDFPEPYVALWNEFAGQRSKPRVSKLSDARRKKFNTRIREKDFDFLGILTRAGKAGDFLSTAKWFTWDWIMESEGNYLKVLEGNYDKVAPPHEMAAAAIDLRTIEYLYAWYLEGQLDSKVITEVHCNFLLQEGLIELDERFILQAVNMRIKNLSGSNQAAELRMIEAYQKGTWPADPDCLQDRANREWIAKKFALYDLFQRGKQLGASSIQELTKMLEHAQPDK